MKYACELCKKLTAVRASVEVEGEKYWACEACNKKHDLHR